MPRAFEFEIPSPPKLRMKSPVGPAETQGKDLLVFLKHEFSEQTVCLWGGLPLSCTPRPPPPPSSNWTISSGKGVFFLFEHHLLLTEEILHHLRCIYIPGTGLSIILMKGLSLRKSWNPETWKYTPLIKTQSFGFSPKIGNFQVGWFSIIFGMVIRWNPKTSQGEGLSAIFCSIAKLESSSHPLTPRCQQPGQVNATHQIRDIS